MSLKDEFEKSLTTNPINYDKVSKILMQYSKTSEFLAEIKTYKPDLSSSPDIIIETLAWSMAFENKPVESSIESQLRVFEIYPYLLFNTMFLRTIEQQRDYFSKLMDLYQDTRGPIKSDQFGKNAEIYKNYLDNYEENFKKNSALVNFNYLAGIRFDKINVPYHELPKNCLIINMGYKLNVPEGSIISRSLLYGNIRNIEGITVTKKDVDSMKLNTNINIYSRQQCYKIVTASEESNDIRYHIVINYNNDPDDKKCLYSVSKNDVPKIFVAILTHGGTIYKVRNQTLRVYFSENLTRRYQKPVSSSEIKRDIDDIIASLSTQLSDRYDEDVDKTIANWKGFNNDEIFDLWLYKLYDFDTFDEETKRHVLNYNNYVCTIKTYFMPVEDYVD